MATATRTDDRIDRLARFVEPDLAGWSRPAFSEAYRASRGFIVAEMKNAGLDVSVDGAGNIIGRLPGRDPNAPPLLTGSHTDTVAGGGRFDGIVGVVGAIEVAEQLRERDVRLGRDLYIVDFYGEEANAHGSSCIGSAAFAGLLGTRQLDRLDDHGETLAAAWSDAGIDPDAAVSARFPISRIRAAVELHIEQGPHLERAGIEIGVVTAIAGIKRLIARFTGRPDHAGTMPMDGRHDALAAAAESVLCVERVGCGGPGHSVATTGRLRSLPGAPNVVPGEAELWAEWRSADAGWLDDAERDLAAQVTEAADRRGVDVELEFSDDADVTPTSASIQQTIASAADVLGHSWQAVPSGAGHDTQALVGLGPVGMIFVPSHQGRSHCPEEFTSSADIERGIDVLRETLTRLDTHP